MAKGLVKDTVSHRRFLQTTAAAGGTLARMTAMPWYARVQVPSFKLGQITPFSSGNNRGAILGAFVVWGVWSGTAFLTEPMEPTLRAIHEALPGRTA